MAVFYLELYRKSIPAPLTALEGAADYEPAQPALYWAVLVAQPTIAGTEAAGFLAPEPLGTGVSTHGTDLLPEALDDYRPYAAGIWWPPSPPYAYTVTAPDGTVIELAPPGGSGADDAFYSLPIQLGASGVGIWLVEVHLLGASRLPTAATNAQLNPDLFPTSADDFERQPLLQLTGPPVKHDCPDLGDLVVVAGCAPGLVTFEVGITGNAAALERMQWDFGDGETAVVEASALVQPARITHTYAAHPAGAAVVTLFRDPGCGDLTPLRSIAVPLCADVTGCPVVTELRENQQCTPDGATTVTVEAITYPPDAPGSYAWDFGDGSPSSQTSIAAQNHVYQAGGTFDVSVTLTPEPVAGAVCPPSTRTKAIAVRTCPPPAPVCPELTGLTLKEQVCIADAGGSATGTMLTTVEVTTAPPNAEGTYEWDFGDSTTATTDRQTTNHAYASGGMKTVTVKLKPRDSRCEEKSITREFDIGTCALPPPPPAVEIFSNCCLVLLILSLLVMAAGAAVLPGALCIVGSGSWLEGAIFTAGGAALLLCGALLFVFWFLWCATVSRNCTLVRIFLVFLTLLAAVSGLLTLAAFVVNLVLAALDSVSLCGWGITLGLTVDTAYFSVLVAVASLLAAVVVCTQWPDGTVRSYVPSWLDTALSWLRARLPPCPLD